VVESFTGQFLRGVLAGTEAAVASAA
jgi:hypothetical protein